MTSKILGYAQQNVTSNQYALHSSFWVILQAKQSLPTAVCTKLQIKGTKKKEENSTNYWGYFSYL